MKKIAVFIFFTLLSNSFFAQKELYDTPVVLFRSQVYGGIGIHTSGFHLNAYKAKYKDATHLRILGVEVLNMKHEKERKGYNESFGSQFKDSKGYYFGKLNSFLILRPTYGGKTIFTKKMRKKGVEFGSVWKIGPSLGFLKPIYLEIIDPDFSYFPVRKYDPELHSIYDIFGRASVFKGLSELKFRPGLFFQYALNLEYSGAKDYLEGFEVGVSGDLFLNKIEIMTEDLNVGDLKGVENNRYFVKLFINFYLGRKDS